MNTTLVHLSTADIVVFVAYIVALVGIAVWASVGKTKAETSSWPTNRSDGSPSV